MDGYIAKLDQICDLAEKCGALVHFDKCHSTDFIGEHGGGMSEYYGCMDKVDIITGTLCKALGEESSDCTSSRLEVVRLLKQCSRPYLFSNSIAPPVVTSNLKVLDLVMDSSILRHQLRENNARFSQGLEKLYF